MNTEATAPNQAHTHDFRQVAVDFEGSGSVVATFECLGCHHTEFRAQ